MPKFGGYRPFHILVNAVNKLANQGFTDLTDDQEKIAELITQELIQAGVLNEYLKTDRPYPTNIHNTLEEFISNGGRQVFIHTLDFDATQGLLTLELQFNPESDDVDKTLVFRDVQDFEDVLDSDELNSDDYDPNCLDSIIGLDQYSTKYILKTHAREISFSSIVVPEISSLKESRIQ